MNTSKLKLKLLLFLLASLLLITCKKEEGLKEDESTPTTTPPPAKTPLDYEIDYKVNMIYSVIVISGNHYAIGLGKTNPTWVEDALVTITQGDKKNNKRNGHG
jgi:hypothetical protein